MGGQQTIDRIVDNFIRQIEYDPHIIEFFLESDIDRFRSKLSEHICAFSGGPCVYSGDSMQDVHAGMHITESDFNRTVDLLIDAMTEAGLSHPQQNKMLALFVPMRRQMIYR
ncbi:globin [Bowmanella sp. JS7-9]|nr:globin [Bowmanella sp. JS7-9]